VTKKELHTDSRQTGEYTGQLLQKKNNCAQRQVGTHPEKRAKLHMSELTSNWQVHLGRVLKKETRKKKRVLDSREGQGKILSTTKSKAMWGFTARTGKVASRPEV